MKPVTDKDVEALRAQIEALEEALRIARESKAAEPEPEPRGVTQVRGPGGWELHLGDIPEEEAELAGTVVAEFFRARQLRPRVPGGTCRPGATVVRADEASNRTPNVHGQSLSFTPKRKIV